MNGLRIELADTTNVLLREIAMPEITRDDIAETYAMAIVSGDKTDWRKVNEAIIARWSESGRDYIKERSWKIINQRTKGAPA